MVQQVGGSHYEAEYQHWDWAVDVNLGYLESAATKYIFRWYKKNGLEDLQKAESYLKKLLDCFDNGRVVNECQHVDTPEDQAYALSKFQEFADSAKVPSTEAVLCLRIARWRTDDDLINLIAELRRHIKAAEVRYHANRYHGPLTALGATTGPHVKAGRGIEHPAPFGYTPEDE